MAKARKKIADASEIIRKGIADNPEIGVVIEIAQRSHVAASIEPPRVIGVATEVAPLPTNSQYPV